MGVEVWWYTRPVTGLTRQDRCKGLGFGENLVMMLNTIIPGERHVRDGMGRGRENTAGDDDDDDDDGGIQTRRSSSSDVEFFVLILCVGACVESR